MQPHVFIVMPFGLKQVRGAISIDFDLLYDRLIAPAVRHAGAVPVRADEEPGAGDIRTDMFYELVTADVVLADVSALNANVFYELGIRHAVAPRGVFVVHGNWGPLPFDIVTDRAYAYDGTLFVRDSTEPDSAWTARVATEAERLGKVLRAGLERDRATIGSPVYKELPGLKPVDWSDVQTARAKYFGDVFADWKSRVEIARLNGCPGDILTLADEAPTRYHAVALLWEAADALCSMHRFGAARSVLQELLALAPAHRDAAARLGVVLARLGQVNEARVHMLAVAEQNEHDPEAHGALGRVYKDLWRLEWRDAPALEKRQQLAAQSSPYLVSAIRRYDAAARRHFDHYTGINVVSLTKLLEHLSAVTGVQPAAGAPADVSDLVAVVRFGAQNALAQAAADAARDGVWAAATLGELDLVTGNVEAASRRYAAAAHMPETTYFHVRSMLDQLALFESLGFAADGTHRIRRMLEERASVLERGTPGAVTPSAPRFAKVAIVSGHMIDRPGRPTKRFPPEKEAAVRDQMEARLAAWNIGAGDLAVCGGARGADILFAELCAARGADVWMLVALEEGEFLEESVRLPGTTWEDRYYRLQELPTVRTFLQPDRLKAPPKGSSAFTRNNLWILNTARVEVDRPRNLHALLVWDEQPEGDGPGGTADFAERVKRLGGRRHVINPTRL